MINFRLYPNMTKAIIPKNIVLTNNNFTNAFRNMYNLQTITQIDNVTSMNNTYYNCTNLQNAACGNNVISMDNTYFYC